MKSTTSVPTLDSRSPDVGTDAGARVKPATPLPWGAGKRVPTCVFTEAYGFNSAGLAAGPLTADCGEREASKYNALYIAHTANAYPKLVAALRAVEQLMHDGVGRPPMEVLGEVQAVVFPALRELGEL